MCCIILHCCKVVWPGNLCHTESRYIKCGWQCLPKARGTYGRGLCWQPGRWNRHKNMPREYECPKSEGRMPDMISEFENVIVEKLPEARVPHGVWHKWKRLEDCRMCRVYRILSQPGAFAMTLEEAVATCTVGDIPDMQFVRSDLIPEEMWMDDADDTISESTNAPKRNKKQSLKFCLVRMLLCGARCGGQEP